MKVYVLMVKEFRMLTELELFATKEEALLAARRVCKRMYVQDYSTESDSLFFHSDEAGDYKVEVLEKEMVIPKSALDIPISIGEFASLNDPFENPESNITK